MDRKIIKIALPVILLLGIIARFITAGNHVQVVGLFPGKAVVVIDGQRSVLEQGGRIGDVKVLEVFNDSALLEVAGVQQRYPLTREGVSRYAEPAAAQVIRLLRHSSGHYFVTGEINGVPVPMILDTGATAIAMNEDHARRLGIDYLSGESVTASTANGKVQSYRVMLRTVSIKGLKVSNVQAVVVKGRFPEKVLLGMSYLTQVNMREAGNGILLLEAKF